MKLDGNAVLFRGTEPEGDNNGAIDSDGLRSEHRLETKEQSGAFCGLKSGEAKTDRLQYVFSDEDRWGIPKLDCSMRANDLRNDDEEKLRHFVAPIPLSRSSLEIESFEKDSVFYVDKSVMEPELPELVVCYKENTYQIVKDICIDDGVPSNDKFLFDTELDEQKLCTYLISEEKNSGLAQGKGDPDMHIPELQVSSTEENLAIGHPTPDDAVSSEKKGSRSEYNVKDLMPTADAEQDATKKVTNGASKEFFSLGELLLMSKMRADLSQSKSSHDIADDVDQLAQRPHENTIVTWSHVSEESENVNEQPLLVNPTTVSTTKESSFDCGCDQASLQIHCAEPAVKAPDHDHERTCKSSPAESTVKESEIGSKEETLDSHNIDVVSEPNRTVGDKFENSRLETGSITLESNSSAPTASQGGDGSQPGGSGHAKSQNSSRPEDTGTEPFSCQLQYCEGESSFSAAGVPISGLISYSGPITYSGSLSLRSDSSTTSTRSFAFPVLQSEWNSSPVRMAKAERRCMRKQRGWRHAILCCRF
ncbi:18S pre-ribosomal assembly protein gar2-related [Euphorbia peplus]|nr:18S pre-ribosomal assembly protein gar2-related [Euphorbia peplus]